MSAIGDERVTIAAKLAAAGIPVVLDPRAVAPFVLVGAPSVVAGAGVGGWTVDYPVHVVATTPAAADQLDWLLEQTELVLRTLGATAADPATYSDRDNPAYTLVYRRDVTNPDC